MASTRAACLMLATLALATVRARTDESPAPAPSEAQPSERAVEVPPDAELLEFLGSLDAEGDEWTEYLTETDIAQVAEEQKDE